MTYGEIGSQSAENTTIRRQGDSFPVDWSVQGMCVNSTTVSFTSSSSAYSKILLFSNWRWNLPSNIIIDYLGFEVTRESNQTASSGSIYTFIASTLNNKGAIASSTVETTAWLNTRETITYGGQALPWKFDSGAQNATSFTSEMINDVSIVFVNQVHSFEFLF